MKELVFSHDNSSIHEAFGVETERRDYLHGAILYNIAYQKIMVDQLFDDEDNVPRNLCTKTGIIERFLENAETEEERLVMMWDYATVDCKIDSNDIRGHLFFEMILKRVKHFDLDQDKFCSWWINKKRQVDAEND